MEDFAKKEGPSNPLFKKLFKPSSVSPPRYVIYSLPFWRVSIAERLTRRLKIENFTDENQKDIRYYDAENSSCYNYT